MSTTDIANRAARLARESRLLLLLQALADDPDYAINSLVLHGLMAEFGHGVSHDVIASDIEWLKEQGLVTTEVVGAQMIVVTITQRGVDVAAGQARIPGIARPRPGQ